MRNLNVQRHVQRSLPPPLSRQPSSRKSQHVVDICPFDGAGVGGAAAGVPAAASLSSSGRILLTQDGRLVRVVEDDGGCDRLVWETSLGDVVEDSVDGGGGGWFSASYVPPSNALVCLSSGGAVASVDPETGEAELVGEFENGIEAGAWSPDGEILALVTFAAPSEDDEDGDDEAGAEQPDGNKEGGTAEGRNSVLLSMNTEFEVLAEVDVEPHVPSRSSPESAVSLCWRPDSSLLAVSTVDVAAAGATATARKVRFYDRETLELRAVGRTEDGSGRLAPNLVPTPISWAGPGCSQLLAAVQRKGKKANQIALFEPNGLRHREFPLRDCDPAASDVLGLDWSPDSDLLAVTIRKRGEVRCDQVQLWHRSNYHWYLKKEFRYPNRRVVRTKFHLEQPSTVYVLFDDAEGQWNEYDVRWDASTVCWHPPESSTAFVVDGRLMNTTPLHKALVPPPMYAATLELPLPVSHIVLPRHNDQTLSSSLEALAVLSDGSIAVIRRGSKTTEMISNYNQPELQSLVKWGSSLDMDPSSFRDFVVVRECSGRIYLVAVAPASHGGNCESLVEISLSLGCGNLASNKEAAVVAGTIQLEGRVLRMVPWLDSADGALIQLEDGQLLEYDGCTSGTVAPSGAEPLLEPCPWIAAVKDCSAFVHLDDNSHRRERLVVGLSFRSRLYCHDLLLSDFASSFVLSPWQKYLSFTTSGSRCQLRFISLQELHDFDPLMGSDGNFTLQGYEPRSIERGATLVAVLPNKPTAVLQLPRGNLEANYPRALVLRHAVLKISDADFKGAFELMRQQKVDLNLMVDLDPVRFLEREGHAGTLVEQVSNIDHLNLFISSLQKSDSTQTRFVIPSFWVQNNRQESSEEEKEFDFEDKVNRTCRVLRGIMIEAEKNGKTRGGREIKEGHFLLPILSTFAKEDPPKLDEALRLIKENALTKHPPSSKKPPLFSEPAQSSIHYLAFLADYELLFETALGMYDYDIARAVARNSQMDPKAYLPLLKRYRELPTYYSRFEVDMRLKRYESALSNLFESGSRDESLDTSQSEGSNSDGYEGNSFDQCLRLIEEQKLHQLGLQLFCDRGHRARIMLSLGNHLLEDRQANAALNVFLASTPPYLDRAMEAARVCRDWGAFFVVLAIHGGNKSSGDDLAQKRQFAREIANGLIADAAGSQRRKMLTDAARVLLDYADDVAAAVEVLLQAEMWNEAHRIGLLYSRDDLVHETVDSAVSYANSAMYYLEERRNAFCAASTRYAEVLVLRKDAIIKGESKAPGASEADDSGSLFSAASNASHLSTASNTSTGTVSSVISVKSTTSFSLSGADEANRHKSKFNQLGDRQKPRRKKKGKGRNKALPGSQKELDGLVQALRSNCVDENYRDEIADTITFLARSEHVDLARCLYDNYVAASCSVQKSQDDRIQFVKQDMFEKKKKARREGIDTTQTTVTLEVEEEVDSMTWASLPDELHRLFSFLPSSYGK